MKIVIKRKDSVASILFFLFNVFLVKRGITAISHRKIFKLMEPFGKSETAVRMELSRGSRSGVLNVVKVEGETAIQVSEIALNGFKYWMNTIDHDQRRIQLQLCEWDGVWRLVLVGKENVHLRDLESFNEILKHYGFGRPAKNVWISPYDLQEEIAGSGIGSDSQYQLYFLESRLCDDTLRSKMISEIWPVRRLNEGYKLFLSALREARAKYIPRLRNGSGLPLLHRFGMEFFENVRDDPHLPLSLLPDDWQGITAARFFGEFRSEILPEAEEFVDRVVLD